MAPPQYFITWFVELSGTSSDASSAVMKSASDLQGNDCHSFFGSIFRHFQKNIGIHQRT